MGEFFRERPTTVLQCAIFGCSICREAVKRAHRPAWNERIRLHDDASIEHVKVQK